MNQYPVEDDRFEFASSRQLAAKIRELEKENALLRTENNRLTVSADLWKGLATKQLRDAIKEGRQNG